MPAMAYYYYHFYSLKEIGFQKISLKYINSKYTI